MWSKNDIVLDEIKNEYKTEKALHETVNAATENLRKAVELKESRKMSPDAKANPLKSTVSNPTARSNVANKQKRSINIVRAMQERFRQQKMKKEHWQKSIMN